jgi:hypothetical protein
VCFSGASRERANVVELPPDATSAVTALFDDASINWEELRIDCMPPSLTDSMLTSSDVWVDPGRLVEAIRSAGPGAANGARWVRGRDRRKREGRECESFKRSC